MFSSQKIFHHFPDLVTYIGARDFLMRPKQFHRESLDLQKNVYALEETFWVKKAFFLAQCQSSEIIEVTRNNLDDIIYADACFTRLQNIALNVVVADCVPILFYDTVQQIIWVVHAGWRGSSEKILYKTLELMKSKHWSEMQNIFMFIWPCISQNNYEVWVEVAELFSRDVLIQKYWKYFLDLRSENFYQAIASGILRQNIEISQECTFELPEKYFSYRREKLKANFVCGIALKK